MHKASASALTNQFFTVVTCGCSIAEGLVLLAALLLHAVGYVPVIPATLEAVLPHETHSCLLHCYYHVAALPADRYVASLTGLLPSDPWKLAWGEQAYFFMNDLWEVSGQTAVGSDVTAYHAQCTTAPPVVEITTHNLSWTQLVTSTCSAQPSLAIAAHPDGAPPCRERFVEQCMVLRVSPHSQQVESLMM